MNDPAYANYWRRKQLLNTRCPHFPVVRWWATDGLCDIEKVYVEAVRGRSSLLDVGAGDLRIKKKLQAAGFAGEYHTQDIGGEYDHTYHSLDDVTRKYAAVVCFDVIEHLPLTVGLTLVNRLIDLLEPGGVLLLQTPNGRCVRSAFGTDMTHLHLYNLPDLWAYLTAAGLTAVGYRVPFHGPGASLRQRLVGFAQKVVATRLIGGDYADNIALVAVK